jgi:hypothetical protein
MSPERTEAMRLIDGELWLARRLSRFGVLCGTFEGVTDSNIRKQRLRETISRRGLTHVGCASELTYGGAFHRLYGEHV